MIEMARRCAFCVSSRRQELEEKILNGEVLQKEVAGILGVSPGAVCLHLKNHLTLKLRQVAQPHLEKFVEGVVSVIGKSGDIIEQLSEKIEEKIRNPWNATDLKVYSSEWREHVKLFISLLKISGFFVQEQE